jgi:hypothetical protein
MPAAHECTQMAAEMRRAVEEPRSPPFRPWERHNHEIQLRIGHELQAQLDLPKDMPHQILALLMQLTNDA